jgi:hypothetical protein
MEAKSLKGALAGDLFQALCIYEGKRGASAKKLPFLAWPGSLHPASSILTVERPAVVVDYRGAHHLLSSLEPAQKDYARARCTLR